LVPHMTYRYSGTEGETRIRGYAAVYTKVGKAGKYCDRERLPQTMGESYHAEYSEMGKAHYMGKAVTEVRSLQRKLMPDIVGSEHRKPTYLRGIADKAKADRKHRFQDLYRHLDAELLVYSFYTLNKDASSGVDGVTWKAYEENLIANTEALVERLKSKTYRARLVRRWYIPKGRKKRP
jgi:hypothetical protein